MSAQPSGNAVSVNPQDRRRCQRYECELKSSCKPIEYPRSATAWPAQVRDISAGGVRLTLCRRFEPGTLLALDVQDTEGVKRLFLIRVVRVARRVRGRWALGCALNAIIDEHDLEGLVEFPFTMVRDVLAGPCAMQPIEASQEEPQVSCEADLDEQAVEALIEATIKAWIAEAVAADKPPETPADTTVPSAGEPESRENIIPFPSVRKPEAAPLPDITPLGLEAEPFQSWIRETPGQSDNETKQGGREAA